MSFRKGTSKIDDEIRELLDVSTNMENIDSNLEEELSLL